MQSRRPWSQRLRWSRRTTAPRLTGVQGVRQPSLQSLWSPFRARPPPSVRQWLGNHTYRCKHGRSWQGANNRRLRSLRQRHRGGLRQLAVERRGRATLGKARRPALLLGDVLEEEGSRLRRCTHHLAGGRDKEARNRAAPAARGPRRLGSDHLPLWAGTSDRAAFLPRCRSWRFITLCKAPGFRKGMYGMHEWPTSLAGRGLCMSLSLRQALLWRRGRQRAPWGSCG